MGLRGYQRTIIGMNAGSLLWWALDLMNPTWIGKDELRPIYFVAVGLFVTTLPLWFLARWRLRTGVGRASALAILAGLVVNVLSLFRPSGLHPIQ